ncbi:pilus assembly protein TadG-related protein [Neobacillus sp. LXY-4]|uniref:pilus assembly protein TadG-related protein n=1 Tax=Neobacillus sp. LXY-4 TaxID=3379826 RepID=UPI003EE3369D
MWINRFLKSTSGVAMVYIAISIVVLIGFTGLVIDGGRLYLARSQLQKAVDAGALAGANVMLEGQEMGTGFNYEAAKIEADELAKDNYNSTKISYNTSFPGDDNIIEVTGQEKVPLFLMPVLGINDSTVSAVAQAKVGVLNEVDKGVVIPIGIYLPGFPEDPEKELITGETWNITSSPGEGVNGNFGFLDFSELVDDGPNGAVGVGYYIENGSPVPISIGNQLATQTGDAVKSSVITMPLSERIGEEVYVPIVSKFGSGTSEKVTVLGFAAFELVGYDKNDHAISAIFIRTILPGELGEGTTNYGTYTVELIL